MKTKPRKFSPAQLAAQARFAKAAKAGTLRRKKRNTTIIKAKKRPIAKRKNASVSTKLYGQLLKAENAYGRLADKFGPMSKQAEKAWKLINTISERIKTDQLKHNPLTPAVKRASNAWLLAERHLERAHAEFVKYHRKYGLMSKITQKARVAEEKAKAAYRAALAKYKAVEAASYDTTAKNPKFMTGDILALHQKWEAKVKKTTTYKAWQKAVAEAQKLQTPVAWQKEKTAYKRLEKLLSARPVKWDAAARQWVKKNPRRGTRAIGLSAKRFARQASTWQGKAPSAIYTAEGRRLRKQYLLAETRFHRLKDSMRAIGIKYGANSPQWYKAHETATKAGEHLAKVQQKYFDYGEKAKGLSPNPNGRRRTVKARKNGANTSLAKQRRSEFVGRPSTQVKTLYAPAGSGAKGTLAQLGKLHKISVKGGKVYNFKGVPTLAQHPKTDQLYVLGKNYTVNVPKKNPGDRLVDLGEVTRIEYEAIKTHLGDTKPVTYYHHFGEEGGKRPHALVNEEGLIIFSGGDYYIRPEGIRD